MEWKLLLERQIMTFVLFKSYIAHLSNKPRPFFLNSQEQSHHKAVVYETTESRSGGYGARSLQAAVFVLALQPQQH